MKTLEYSSDGWVCDRFPYNIQEVAGQIEVSDEVWEKTMSCDAYYAWRIVDGELIMDRYEEKVWTQEERLQERIELHESTDDDFAKYARQVRLNIDMPHSQQVLDYIDNYNLQVSDTVNQPGFPQNVTYPEYILP